MTADLTVSAVCDTSDELGACAYGHVGRCAWVVDGSAPGLIDPEQVQPVADFVTALNLAMYDAAEHDQGQELLASDPEVAVQVVVDLACSRWRTVHGDQTDVPQASLAVVHVGSTDLMTYVVGDCAVILRTPEYDTAARDPQFVGGFDDDALEAVRAEIAAGTDPAVVYSQIEGLRREMFEMRNSPAADGPEVRTLTEGQTAALAGQVSTHPLTRRGESVLLATSGLLRMDRELAGALGVSLMETACGIGIDEALSLIRITESGDPQCRDSARFGAHRGAAGVLIRSAAEA